MMKSADAPQPTVLGYDEDGRPFVPATFVRHRRGDLFTIHCPFCGQTHTHGAGRHGEDPRDFAFHRVAHCRIRTPANSRGYVLAYNGVTRVGRSWRSVRELVDGQNARKQEPSGGTTLSDNP